jgi:type IV pilus assembly protein PilO
MGLIPEESKQKNALAGIVFCLVAVYFANSMWYSGAQEELAAQQARLESLETQNRVAQTLAITGGQDLEARMAVYERHIAQLEQLIPGSEEVAALVNELSRVARDVGISMNMMRPEASEPGAFYTKETFEIRVLGEYHDVGRFLTRIASLSRIVTPSDLQLEPFTDTRGATDYLSPVQVTFRIQTYVVPDREGEGP